MAKQKFDPVLRAQFKEHARGIMAHDRFASKHGLSQNTIGKITSALVKAYEMGCNAEKNAVETDSTQTDGAIDWNILAPRVRDALFYISIHLGSMTNRAATSLDFRMESFESKGKMRWRKIAHNNRKDASSITDGTMLNLIKLELMEPTIENKEVFTLSQKGIETCKVFWDRWDSNDRTLPVMSMR